MVDDYHGTKVADPYRWLEDTNSPETTAWVEAENKLTAAYLAHIPERAKIHARLTELFNYERYSSAFEVAGKYFLFRNDGLQNQDVLYVADKPDGAERVLLDPNTLRADGTAALSGLVGGSQRQTSGLRHRAGWLGLVGVARARHRDRQGFARFGAMDQIHQRRVDRRWPRVLLPAVPAAE